MKGVNLMKIGAAASVVFVAAAVVLYVLSRQSDPASFRQSIGHVQEIQQLATEWSVETARVRADPMADYDALAAFIPRMEELKRRLLDAVAEAPAIPDRLANDVSAYASAIDAKEERVERFKTANSVVRNSARYLPLAAADIVRNDADDDLADEVTTLANDIGEYLAAPTDAAKGRLTAVVERLGYASADLPAPLDRGVANFLAHARVLLDRQGSVEEMFAQATSADIAVLSARLIGDLGAELSRLDARTALFTNGVFAVVAGLLLLWVALALVRARAAAATVTTAPDTPSLVWRGTRHDVPEDAADPAGGPPAPAVPSIAEKRLLAQQVVADMIGQRIADASRRIAERARGLPTDNGSADNVRTDALRIAALADGLAALGAGRESSYELVDVNDCLAEAVAATDADAVAAVAIEPGTVPEVFASRVEICFILEKVIENAVQAIRDKDADSDAKGRIRITTRGDAEHATVTVIDNGVGMSREVRERIFEPFYAGREGRAGIGLTTSAQLVEKYNGSFAVSSHEGGGTVMRIELPGMSAK